MITLKEFWESKDKLAIHCKEEWQAKKLCCAFHRMGKKWCNGKSYIKENDYEIYKDETCYSNDGGFSGIGYLKKANYKIIEFDQIDDFNFTVGDRVRVRQWDDMVNEYGDKDGYIYNKQVNCYFFRKMKKTCGKEFTIVEIRGGYFVRPQIDDWGIPLFALEKVYDIDTKEKQYCIVVSTGESYRLYADFIEKFFPKYIDLFKYVEPLTIGKRYIILGHHKHEECDVELYLIQDEDTKQVFLIGEDGIKILDNKTDNYIKKEIRKEEKENMFTYDYSFRFNEERQSVTLYRNGVKVQFVKPQKDDKFNWKTGLGVCLYKQLYKGQSGVEYVKSIVNEKTFYNYCVAKFFGYDKSRVEILEEHVKNCKREYCEFQLSKI